MDDAARTLKAPVGVWVLVLDPTWVPVRVASSGHACCSVGGTIMRTSGTAASSTVNEKSGIVRYPRGDEV